MARQSTAQLIFPNREAVTTGQLQNAITVCNMTVTALINPWRGFTGEEENSPKNSEARIALENTLIKACDRLDKILSDDRRWSIDYQMNLEDEFKKSHTHNLRFLEAQSAAAEEVASPHFQHKPKLAKSQDGQLWVAILGDETDLKNAIVGMGRTPEEALAEFDNNFRGQQNSPEVIAFLKKRVEDQKNYGQEHQMEHDGTDGAVEAAGGENSGEENSGNPEPTGSVNSGANVPLGPTRPGYGKSVSVSAGRVGLLQGRKETRKAGLRKVASFLSRLFRLDKSRSRG